MAKRGKDVGPLTMRLQRIALFLKMRLLGNDEMDNVLNAMPTADLVNLIQEVEIHMIQSRSKIFEPVGLCSYLGETGRSLIPWLPLPAVVGKWSLHRNTMEGMYLFQPLDEYEFHKGLMKVGENYDKDNKNTVAFGRRQQSSLMIAGRFIDRFPVPINYALMILPFMAGLVCSLAYIIIMLKQLFWVCVKFCAKAVRYKRKDKTYFHVPKITNNPGDTLGLAFPTSEIKSARRILEYETKWDATNNPTPFWSAFLQNTSMQPRIPGDIKESALRAQKKQEEALKKAAAKGTKQVKEALKADIKEEAKAALKSGFLAAKQGVQDLLRQASENLGVEYFNFEEEFVEDEAGSELLDERDTSSMVEPYIAEFFTPFIEVFNNFSKPRNKLDLLYESKLSCRCYITTSGVVQPEPMVLYIAPVATGLCLGKKMPMLVVEPQKTYTQWMKHSVEGICAYISTENSALAERLAISCSFNKDMAARAGKMLFKAGLHAAAALAQGGVDFLNLGSALSGLCDVDLSDIWFPGKPDLENIRFFDATATRSLFAKVAAARMGLVLPEIEDLQDKKEGDCVETDSFDKVEPSDEENDDGAPDDVVIDINDPDAVAEAEANEEADAMAAIDELKEAAQEDTKNKHTVVGKVSVAKGRVDEVKDNLEMVQASAKDIEATFNV